VLLLIGAIYYQLRNYEQCIAFNDRCILLDPSMAEAHANMANALQQTGSLDMAIIYYQVCTTGQTIPARQLACANCYGRLT
jgi:protein O-GlcNAc transferase